MKNNQQPTQEQKWKVDIEEFEGRAIEIFEHFLVSLQTIDLSKEGEESDYSTFISEDFQFVYPQRSSQLARRMLKRLYAIGNKYFPDQDINIETHLWREL